MSVAKEARAARAYGPRTIGRLTRVSKRYSLGSIGQDILAMDRLALKGYLDYLEAGLEYAIDDHNIPLTMTMGLAILHTMRILEAE